MPMLTIYVLFAGILKTILSQSLADPRVYNCYFYLNTNADLNAAGIGSCSAGENHWLTYGLNEGRQACGSFHVLQFLDNYPSLAQQFGNNYTAAILYYLNTGYQQGMLGYVIGGAYGRYTLGNIQEGIFLSGSDRMGVAIDSVVYNNTEFINTWDHGRELQVATTTQYGECYNPTEAGSSDDLYQDSTSSIVALISVDTTSYKSVSYPAYWLQPGQCESTCCAINTQITSNWTFSKTIQIGYNGIAKVLYYQHSVLVPIDLTNSGVQIEAPTGYQVGDIFTTFYTVDVASGGAIENWIIEPEVAGSIIVPYPPVICTPDTIMCMGALPRDNPARGYLFMNYAGLTPQVNACTKWSILQYITNVKMNTQLNFETWVCIGNLQEVQKCMMEIYATF